MKLFRRFTLIAGCTVSLILALTLTLSAGTVGKISGIVTDEKGEAIPGVTIRVDGTNMGAPASYDGSYVIQNIPPGSYTLTAQILGYNKMTIQEVKVQSDITTEINFKLTSEAVKAEDIVVIAETVEIDKYVASNQIKMSSEELSTKPITDIGDVLRQTTGFVQQNGVFHARGGRGNEIAYMVDGIEIRDVLGGTSRTTGDALKQNLDLSATDIEELSVLKGSFDAENGSVNSAIVNVVRKEGSNKTTTGRIEFLSDDLGFGDLNKYSFNSDRLEWNLSGPVPGISDQLFPALGMKWPGEKMSYFMSFAVEKSNDYLDYNNYDSPNSRIDYGYEKFLGMKIPHRRSNKYSANAKVTWKMDTNARYKMSFNYLNTWQKFTNFDYIFLYVPHNAHKITESKEMFGMTFTFSPDFLKNTFGELKFNRYIQEYEQKPGGLLPGDFVPFDNWESYIDANRNGKWDAAEPYIDTNGDGFFGEPFEDQNLNGQRDPSESFTDLNGNGIYDPDIGEPFSDLNGNGRWDKAELINNDHYFFDYDNNGVFNNHGDPFDDLNGNGAWDSRGVWEPYEDDNGNGTWDPAEPFVDQDGNGYWNPGESFTDTNGNGQYDRAEVFYDYNESGAWDDWEPYEDIFDNGVYDPGDFAYQDSLDRGNGVYDPQLRDVINEDRAEPYTDGDVVLGEPYIDVDFNGFFNSPPDIFIGAWDLNNNGQHDGPNDPWSEGVPYRDLNNNGRYDAPNGSYDYGEPFVDVNNNGRFDEADGFFDQGFDQWAVYQKTRTVTNTFQFDLTSQVNKQHEIKSGIQFKDMTLEMGDLRYPHLPYDGLDDGGPWPDRGVFRDFYTRTPKQGSFYVRDNMEYGEMIANIGLRYDFYIQANEIQSTNYQAENLNDQEFLSSLNKFSPRIAFSFPVSDKAKLYFNYGHFHQLPEFNYFYRRPTQASNAFGIIGNPNLDFQKTIQYEVGLQYKVSDGYILTISGFYKDYYGLLNSVNMVTGPISTDVYQNVDYARSRGMEFELEKRYAHFFAGSIDYEYTWAFGKNSSESADYFRRFYRQEIPVQEYPLDWDIRHQITFTGDIRAQKGRNPKFGIFSLPDDWFLNFIWQFKTGLPFTPDSRYPGLVLVGREEPLTNSKRMPYFSSLDVRFDKNFQVWELNYTFTVRVNNMFDRKNVGSVYGTTGLPYTNQNTNGQILTGVPFDQNPTYYGPGRQLQVGLSLSF